MITSFFDINNVFFTLWDYPMSYLEFFGTVLNILTVWLCTKKSIWNWPIGILGVICFAILFYKIQLYSDFLEQIYYFVTGIWGWWVWSKFRNSSSEKSKERSVSILSGKGMVWTGVAITFGTLILGWCIARIHIFFPAFFPEAASFPYLDSFTTALSFAAQVLLIFRKIENWYLWIGVDLIGIWLYNQKEVKFVAFLYFIFLILAMKGWFAWKKEMQSKRVSSQAILSGKEIESL